jgi:RNA polymerase sigma factor (sigma-70 family)
MNPAGPELLGQLLDRHGRALVLFARQWCVSPEDVVQEAFVRLARERPCPHDPAAWLFRVVRNGAISAGRSESRRRRHEATAAELSGADPFEPTSETTLDSQTATEALDQLQPDEREVVIARLWGGLTFTQIAEINETSASGVHRKYQNALQKLRKLLGEPCLPNDSTKKSPQN